MRKLAIITLCILSLGCLTFAQSRANKLMERAERSVYSGEATLVDFTSTYFDSKGKQTGRSLGIMYLQGENFRLEYGSIVAVFSGKTLTYHNSNENTLTISEPSADELIQINPLHFLRSHGRGYTAKILPATKATDILGFTPRSKSNIKLIEVSFSRSTGAPIEIVVKGDDGGRFIASITSIRAGSAMNASRFTLSKQQFPGCEVVDLR